MSEAGFVTVTCPHCSQRLRAKTADAGRKVRCPHPNCLRPVPVPFPLDTDNEPDEPILLAEDPANPEPVPVAVPPVRQRPKAVPVAAPAPRRKPTRPSPAEKPRARAGVLPWAVTACACLLASVAVAGWVRSAIRNDSERSRADGVAALEARNRDLRDENRKLRDRLNPPQPAAPSDASAPSSAPKPTPVPVEEPPPPARPDNPPPRPIENPWANRPPKNDPPLKPKLPPAEGRDVFVGKWSVDSPEIKKQGIEIDMTIEFRHDGTCHVEARIAGMNQQLNGKWRWDGRHLHVEMDQAPDAGKPAEVKWNGPDEFTMSGDDRMMVTLRRKK